MAECCINQFRVALTKSNYAIPLNFVSKKKIVRSPSKMDGTSVKASKSRVRINEQSWLVNWGLIYLRLTDHVIDFFFSDCWIVTFWIKIMLYDFFFLNGMKLRVLPNNCFLTIKVYNFFNYRKKMRSRIFRFCNAEDIMKKLMINTFMKKEYICWDAQL